MRILLCGLLCLLASCSKKNEPKDHDSFYVLSGFSAPGTEIFINGNPTNSGHPASLYIIQGENKIECRGNFKEEGYQLLLAKTKNFFSNDYETILDLKKSAEEAQQSSTDTFNAEHWWRWAWQDCDTLDEFTASDKEAILKLYEIQCSDIKKNIKNIKFLFTHPDIILWSDHTFFTERMEKFIDQHSKNAPAPELLVETKAEIKDTKLLVGKQIVLLKPTKLDYLYRLEEKKKEEPAEKKNGFTMTYHYGFDVMYFVKKDGKWKMLLPVN